MAHHLHIKKHHRRTVQTWDPDFELEQALKQRALFLDKHPQYHSFQREIDGMLEKAGNAENRMAVLALLIEAKLIELHGQLTRLNRILLSVPA